MSTTDATGGATTAAGSSSSPMEIERRLAAPIGNWAEEATARSYCIYSKAGEISK